MPCDCSHMQPKEYERESLMVLTFLKEAGINVGKYDSSYGRPKTIHKDTARLCEWCKEHPNRIKDQSLEFQIWWRDHQAADRAKADAAARWRQEERLRRSGLSKLTPDERKALGLK